MPLREILVRNFDSFNSDPVLDRKGCRKRGMVDAIFISPHSWGPSEGLPKFVVIKCDLTDADLETYEGFRKKWYDNKNLKQKTEAVYMYQRFRFNIATMDAAVAAGGTLELTKAQLLSAIRDLMAE